jgi:tetratricopeptide (TPR) repeat protein
MAKVFISYSWDSKEHKERVLVLSNKLRTGSVDCTIDQYIDSPPEGWPLWMERQVENADYVLIICTETYLKKFKAEVKQGTGLGVKWESLLTVQHLYDNDSLNHRFIPVVLDSDECQFIPMPLKGATCYCLDTPAGYEQLYRRLTGQPEVQKPPLGEPKPLPPKSPNETFLPRFLQKAGRRRQPNISRLPVTGPDLFGREKQLKLLHDAWQDEGTTMVTLIAFGGVGKTALVNKWLNEMRDLDYGGALRVYGWSFYSQGAGEGRQVSADLFMQETLAWFGDPDPKAGSALEKGNRLAGLIREEPTLLILDGLEPLQFPPVRDKNKSHGLEGQVKDPGLRVLLKALAVSMPGLCVVSSRERLSDLKNQEGHSVKVVPLETLGVEAGVKLLDHLKVTGPVGEKKKAVKAFGGHALALKLLGNYLSTVFDGDIRKRDLIVQLTDDEEQGGHAWRVMASYESWLGESAERDILYLMGLFDRPAPAGAIAALRKEAAIPGVTEGLQSLSHANWKFALKRLRGVGLLSEGSTKEETLDCHPLIREYFAKQLQERSPDGWQEAHTRLYHYYKSVPEKEYPDTLQEMEPLFAAVAHGCQAGLHEKALSAVFWSRIRRRDQFYTWHQLGAYGADLAAVAHFFDEPWNRPADELTGEVKGFVLNWIAIDLRAMGRLREAIEPMEVSLEKVVLLEKWKNAAIAASNLSELLLSLGRIAEAVVMARNAVKYADQSRDGFQKGVNKSTLADALLQQGEMEEAEMLFREVEEIQKMETHDFPYLFSLPGYRYCNFLLAKGWYIQVMARVEITIKIAISLNHSLSIALDHLSLGRAYLMRAQESQKVEDWRQAKDYLDRAVVRLMEAGSQVHISSGFLARASYHRLQGEFVLAAKDLKEAHQIATYGEMKLHLIDYYLELSQLEIAKGNKERGEAEHAIAHEMIEECGYSRKRLATKAERHQG